MAGSERKDFLMPEAPALVALQRLGLPTQPDSASELNRDLSRDLSREPGLSVNSTDSERSESTQLTQASNSKPPTPRLRA